MTDLPRPVDPVGIVLAAGAGTRMGLPKALVGAGTPRSWLRGAVDLLRRGGCGQVVVVLGAGAGAASRLVEDLNVTVVVAADWADGLSASLARGLAAAEPGSEAAVITLVDLPDLVPEVVTRLLDRVGSGPAVAGRAAYHGRPGHPVVLGRDHWEALAAELSGDSGARDYLLRIGAITVECADLACGDDVDWPGTARRG